MPHIRFHGALRHRLSSLSTLSRIALSVHARHMFGHKVAPDWDATMETGIRFWRHQFTVAMRHRDISEGRAYYNSLQTLTDDVYDVEAFEEPDGTWFEPKRVTTKRVLLYFHGGGYTFGGPNAFRFASMLAHHSGARLRMPHYRRTPEHPQPAQIEDAEAAWGGLSSLVATNDIILIGDSAGAHLALMLLQALKKRAAPQPRLCVALSPWVDIGDDGASMRKNDHFDLVQGWMARQFGTWLDPKGQFGRQTLSPIFHDYFGVAPIYLQAGGRDIFRDQAVAFAKVQAENGAHVMVDIWDDMPHDFQAYDSLFASSTQALRRIRSAIHSEKGLATSLPNVPGVTQMATGAFRA